MPLLPIGKILARAALVRHKAGYLDAEPPYSTHRIIEAAFPDVAVAGADLPLSIAEMVESRNGRRALWYNRKLPHAVQRIGLMHGLHHLLTDLRHGQGLRECNTGLRALERAGHLSSDLNEHACDLFGAELLAPLDMVDAFLPSGPIPTGGSEFEGWLDLVDKLASKFNVPADVMRARAEDVVVLRRTHLFVD